MSPKNRKKRGATKRTGRARTRYDSVQKLIVFKVERDAKQIEKGWYQEVFIGENLPLKQFDELGKKYGLEKEAKIAFVFSQNPNVFNKDNDWFPYLQNFYIVLAERELEARARGEVINDPFMRIYLKLKKNEIDDFAYKMRYYVYYKEAKFINEDLLKYVSADDVKVMKLYINELAVSHANTHSWFDAFQRLYIAVVKSLQIIRNYPEFLNKLPPIKETEPQPGQPLDETKEKTLKGLEGLFRNPKIDEPTKELIADRVNAILANPPIQLPAVAPELYKNPQKLEDYAIAFLNRVYGKFLATGVLYQDQLGVLDSGLLNALKGYCTRKKIALSSIIPPKKERIDKELAQKGADRSDLNRLLSAKRRRQTP